MRALVSAILLTLPFMQAAAQAANTITSQEKAAGWKLLFDGKTGAGWHSARAAAGFPTVGWEIKDGLLNVVEPGGEEAGKGGDLISDRKYSNFELLVDFRIARGANSGIKYLVNTEYLPGHEGHGSPIGFEYQILDDAVHPDAHNGKDGDRTLASLYDLIRASQAKPTRPVGEWNTARIVLRGNHGEHWLNGVKVLEYDRASPDFKRRVAESKFHVYPHFGESQDGYLLLQDHGFPVSFRNIKVRELPQ